MTMIRSETNTTPGPERDPTAIGYPVPHPSNRIEEMQSFGGIAGEYDNVSFTIYANDNYEGIIEFSSEPNIMPNVYVDDNGDVILIDTGTLTENDLSRLRFESVDDLRVAIIGDLHE